MPLRRRCVAARSCGGLKLGARVNAPTGPSRQQTATRTILIKQQHFLVQKSARSTASRYIGFAYILFEICWDLWNFESNPDVGLLEGIAAIHPASPWIFRSGLYESQNQKPGSPKSKGYPRKQVPIDLAELPGITIEFANLTATMDRMAMSCSFWAPLSSAAEPSSTASDLSLASSFIKQPEDSCHWKWEWRWNVNGNRAREVKRKPWRRRRKHPIQKPRVPGDRGGTAFKRQQNSTWHTLRGLPLNRQASPTLIRQWNQQMRSWIARLAHWTRG